MYTRSMIETIAMIWVIFGGIIAVGLLLAWLNDSLESFWRQSSRAALSSFVTEPFLTESFSTKFTDTVKPNHKIIVYQIPPTQLHYAYPTKQQVKTDLNQKIVRIDFSQGRPLKQEDQLGPHVRVLSRAA